MDYSDSEFTALKAQKDELIRRKEMSSHRHAEHAGELRKQLEQAKEEIKHWKQCFLDANTDWARTGNELGDEKTKSEQLESQLQKTREELRGCEYWHKKRMEEVESLRTELEQVKVGISEIINALQVTMKNLIAELDRIYKESIGKWNTDADMYEQGKADAYDMAEQLIKSYLNDWKSTAITPEK